MSPDAEIRLGKIPDKYGVKTIVAPPLDHKDWSKPRLPINQVLAVPPSFWGALSQRFTDRGLWEWERSQRVPFLVFCFFLQYCSSPGGKTVQVTF